MFAIPLILIDCLLIYHNKLRFILILCYCISLTYLILELIQLLIIKNGILNFHETIQNRIRSIKQKQTSSPSKLIQKSNKINQNSNKSQTWISKLFATFVSHSKSPKNQVKQMNNDIRKVHKKISPNKNKQLQLQQRRSIQQANKIVQNIKKQAIEQQEIKKKLKIKELRNFILRQLKQFALSFLYCIFVVQVVLFKRVSVIRGTQEGIQINYNRILNIWNKLQTKFYIQLFIFLVPIIINSLWKFHRICVCLISKLGNKKVLTKQKQVQRKSCTIEINIKDEKGMSKSKMIQSQSYSIIQIIQQNRQESLQIIVSLLHLQCISQICVFFYSTIYSCAYILDTIRKICLWIYFCYIQQNRTYCKGFNLWNEFKFIMKMSMIVVFMGFYVLIKQHYNQNRSIGMRQALWGVHMQVDKFLKLISLQLRKFYHRKIHKLMKKLEKYGIISQGTRHKAKSYHPHNITNEDILMLEYYSSI